jgi:beta-galactosidase
MLRVKGSRMKPASNPARALFTLIAVLLAGHLPAAGARTTENFDAGWLFLKADAPGAEQNNFSDAAWRKLDLPHDWSIEGPFAETNAAGGAGAFLPSGVAWYRKHFSLAKAEAEMPGRPVFIEFDGVMANSDVWINGFHLGHRPNGCVSFNYELTGHLNFNGDNVIAVRADTSEQPASRWYEGAGIYRHVRLVVTDDAIRFAQNGVFVSTPEVSATQATVRVQISVTNELHAPASVATTLIAPNGKIVGTVESSLDIGRVDGSSLTITGSPEEQLTQQITFPKPLLWDLDNPKLYRAVSEIICDEHVRQGIVLDEVTNTFGIRDAHFEADTGFWLNGKNFKLNGVCLHADGGAFGAAVPLSGLGERLKT